MILKKELSAPNDISNPHNIKTIYSFYGAKLDQVKPYLKYFNEVSGYNVCDNLYDYYYTDNGINIWVNLGTMDKDKALKTLNNRIAEGLGKSNKIKLLLNSPLLKGDKLEVVNGKLCHYHKMGKVLLDGSENWKHFSDSWGVMFDSYSLSGKIRGELTFLTDKIPVLPFTSTETSFCCKGSSNYEDRERIFIKNPPNIQMKDVQNFKQWLQNNPITVVYELAEPYYEEVLKYNRTNNDSKI